MFLINFTFWHLFERKFGKQQSFERENVGHVNDKEIDDEPYLCTVYMSFF